MTDDDFREMTERLTALKTEESRGTVTVRPEVVVEVAYSDIQRSSNYAGGMALRFARIVGVRSDKIAAEADTIEAVAAAFDRQLVKPAAASERTGRGVGGASESLARSAKVRIGVVGERG